MCHFDRIANRIVISVVRMSTGERERGGAIVGGPGMVPWRAAAGGGGAVAASGRGLPGAGDHEEPRAAARAVGVLGPTQTLHCTDHA